MYGIPNPMGECNFWFVYILRLTLNTFSFEPNLLPCLPACHSAQKRPKDYAKCVKLTRNVNQPKVAFSLIFVNSSGQYYKHFVIVNYDVI